MGFNPHWGLNGVTGCRERLQTAHSPHGVMIRENIVWLEDLPIIVTGALGLGHTLLMLIQVVPGGAVAALQAELLTGLLRVGQRPARLVTRSPTLLVHLALRTGHCW